MAPLIAATSSEPLLPLNWSVKAALHHLFADVGGLGVVHDLDGGDDAVGVDAHHDRQIAAIALGRAGDHIARAVLGGPDLADHVVGVLHLRKGVGLGQQGDAAGIGLPLRVARR